jgi:hypothetical protein
VEAFAVEYIKAEAANQTEKVAATKNNALPTGDVHSRRRTKKPTTRLQTAVIITGRANQLRT